MNITQKQNVLNQIEAFKNLNLEEIFASKFGNDANPENTSAGDYSVFDIFVFSKRVVVQLEERLFAPDYWQMLPASQNFNNDFENCDLNSQLSKLTSYIGSANYENCVASLKSLIYYQIINGFWEQPKKMEASVKMKTLENIEMKLNLANAHLNERSKLLEELVSKSQLVKEQLDKFVSDEMGKFNTLTINLETSATTLESIDENLTKSSTLLGEITEVHTKSITTKIAIDKIQTSSSEELTKIKTDFENFKTDSTNSLTVSENKLKAINEDHQYVTDKKEEVRKMMGYIADGTLSHSFNSRKTKIQTSVWWWFGGSIASALLMAAWIFVVFTCLKADTGNAIADIFINIAKTSPMIVLFWFALNQYQKERNLLEEYAFREAMAITLTAYLDQLHDEKDEHKRELLLNTVEKLYTKPKISNEGVGLFDCKSKDLVDLVREVKEIVLDIKTKK